MRTGKKEVQQRTDGEEWTWKDKLNRLFGKIMQFVLFAAIFGRVLWPRIAPRVMPYIEPIIKKFSGDGA